MIGKESVVAIITARAGSKGIPGKNWKPLLGKPLVNWSVLAANLSVYIDYIVVSTNCKEVKAVVKKCEVEECITKPLYICDRPDEISTDSSRNEDALLHGIDFIASKVVEPHIIVNLQPTSPIRMRGYIDRGLETMFREGTRSFLSVRAETPLFVQKNKEGSIKWHFDRLNRKMRQDISFEEMYLHDDGSVYGCYSEVLKKENCRIDSNPSILLNDKFGSIQIDTLEDFDLIEALCISKRWSSLA